MSFDIFNIIKLGIIRGGYRWINCYNWFLDIVIFNGLSGFFVILRVIIGLLVAMAVGSILIVGLNRDKFEK